MSRPRLAIGTFGEITTRLMPSGRYEARTRYRDWDGQARQVQGGATAKAAEQAPNRWYSGSSGNECCGCCRGLGLVTHTLPKGRQSMKDAAVDGPVWIPTLPPSIAEFFAPNLQPIPLIPILALVLAATYLLGAVTLWRRRIRWSVIRSISFLTGCLVLVVIMGAGIEGYGYELFSVFMFQQLTLMMIVPPLLVCGSPGTLLLKATPHRGVGLVILRAAFMGLRSPLSMMAIHPAFTIALFLTTLYGLYFTEVASLLLRTWTGHVGLELYFLAAGLLFAIPLFSTDPLPQKLPYGGQVLEVFIKMPLHVIFGVIVMLATSPVVTFFASPPPSWGVDAILDQRTAGALAWSYGEFPSLIILIMLLMRWQHDEGVRTRAADKRTDRDGDVDLDAYNAYLGRLR